MAEKPPNFDEMAAAWDKPQQWMMEVAIYNDYLSLSGDDPAPVDIGPRHSRQMQDHLHRQAGMPRPVRRSYHTHT